jgi:hypothetical protein
MPKQCSTCVFKKLPNGDWLNPDLAHLVSDRLLQVSQICHHPRLHSKKEDHLCRGTRDRQIELMYRMGVIAAPTDAAWEAKRKELGC